MRDLVAASQRGIDGGTVLTSFGRYLSRGAVDPIQRWGTVLRSDSTSTAAIGHGWRRFLRDRIDGSGACRPLATLVEGRVRSVERRAG